MKIITKDLSQEETKDLQKELKTLRFTGFIVAGICLYFVYDFYKKCFILHENCDQNTPSIIFGSLSGFALSLIVIRFIQLRKNLKGGKKEVLIGVLTKKSSNKIERVQHYNHYFYFGEQIIDLGEHSKEDAYNDIEIGQTVSIERNISSKAILKIEVLKESE